MWTRYDLKERAREVFASCRWTAIGVSLLFAIASGGSSGGGGGGNNSNSNDYKNNLDSVNMKVLVTVAIAVLLAVAIAVVIGLVIRIFVTNPLEIGTRRFFMKSRFQKAEFSEVAFGFQNGYINNVVTLLLRQLYIFLWSLLCFVPGIIKSYEYRMMPYIMAENPNIERKNAFELSKKMMDGQKWDTFILDLSFIPWALLTVATCGLAGIFYYLPYYNCTQAELYAVLREDLITQDAEAAMLLPGLEGDIMSDGDFIE